jgi:IS1 family transposase
MIGTIYESGLRNQLNNSLDIREPLTYSLDMNTLPMDRKMAIVSNLVEGSSIRSIERITGVHRDTIMRLGANVGQSCAKFLDAKVKNVAAKKVQCDEIWTYVFKKQARISVDESAAGIGDQYVFIALDSDTKLVINYHVGKRDATSAFYFMRDLESRLANRVQLTTDGFPAYRNAVEDTFGANVDYAQLVKIYGQPKASAANARNWYEPVRVIGAIPARVTGHPSAMGISTSHIERQNLTMRMQMRRFTRLTNAYSKKLDNLKGAIALHFAHYNFVRVHQTLRTTPAMASQLTDHLWSFEELLDAISRPN